MAETMTRLSTAPARDSIGGALRSVRHGWRRIAAIAGIGAAGTTVLALGALALETTHAPFALVLGVLNTVLLAAVYAALIGAALEPNAPLLPRLAASTGRVWSAMVIVGFMLVLTMFAVCLPISMALAPYLAPYGAQIQAAQGDETAFMNLLARFFQQQPLPFGLMFLVIAAAWMLMSSRFYLAAPASIDAKRIQTFETWPWTKNQMLRITIARIVLLGPAIVLFQALTILSARALGFDMLRGGDTAAFAAHNPAAYGAFIFVSVFLQILVYNALEAGLATSFYRVLKPAAAKPI